MAAQAEQASSLSIVSSATIIPNLCLNKAEEDFFYIQIGRIRG